MVLFFGQRERRKVGHVATIGAGCAIANAFSYIGFVVSQFAPCRFQPTGPTFRTWIMEKITVPAEGEQPPPRHRIVVP
jgi:hypothetical protein